MQQATLNLPSSSPVRAMTGLAKTLALPAEAVPQRLPSFPQLERTAVMGFNQPLTLATQSALDPVKFVLARDAAFPCWHSAAVVSTSVYSCTYTMRTTGNASSTIWQYSINSDGAEDCVAENGSTTSTFVPTSINGIPWGTQVPLGYDAELGSTPFLYVPSVQALACSVGYPGASSTTVSSASARYQRWSRPGEVLEDDPSVIGAAALSLPASGNVCGGGIWEQGNITPTGNDTGYWVRPMTYTITNTVAAVPPPRIFVTFFVLGSTSTYAPAAGAAGAWTISANPNARGLLPVGVAPEYATSRVPYQSTRLTAVAALISNVTQVLNKGGTILAGRINPENVEGGWAAVVADTVAALHPAEKAWLPLETGLYTYAPPGPDLAMFYDYTLQLEDRETVVMRLDNPALANVAFLTGPTPWEGAITLTTHLEFKTSSALWTIGVSGYTLETLHIAQMALMSSGFFFENPEHKSLLARIAAGIRKLEPYASPVVTMAKAVHPPTGAVLSAAYNAARAFTLAAEKSQKKATNTPRKIAIKAGPIKIGAPKSLKAAINGNAKGKRKK